LSVRAAEVLKRYEGIERESASMLAAAVAGNREALVAAERRCAALAAELKRAGEPPLDRAQQCRKMDLILAILSNDREVRAITEPWMAELTRLIHGARMQRNVANLYA